MATGTHECAHFNTDAGILRPRHHNCDSWHSCELLNAAITCYFLAAGLAGVLAAGLAAGLVGALADVVAGLAEG